jgi:hypothetical protein
VVYEGLREDKPAAEVRRPIPHSKPASSAMPLALVGHAPSIGTR